MDVLLKINKEIYSSYHFIYSKDKDIIAKLQVKIPERLKFPSENFSSNRVDLFKAVDEYLNLSHRNLNNLFEIFNSQNLEDIQEILNIINQLIKHGIVGYEYLEIRNRPYKCFISTGLVTPFSRAKIYRKPDLKNKTTQI